MTPDEVNFETAWCNEHVMDSRVMRFILKLGVDNARLREHVIKAHTPIFNVDRCGKFLCNGINLWSIKDVDGGPPKDSDRIGVRCRCGWSWDRWVTWKDREECAQAHDIHVNYITDEATP